MSDLTPEQVREILAREMRLHPGKFAALMKNSEPFAVSRDNPVKARSIDEGQEYMTHLYTPEGRHVKSERAGTAPGKKGTLLDMYVLTFESEGTKKTLRVYVNSFADENSREAPEGLKFYDEDPEELFVQGHALYDTDRKRAVSLWKKASELGNADAQYNLALMFENARKCREALDLYMKAAEHGHVKALTHIARMYFRGYGVNRDYDEALRYYAKAADKGSPEAQNELACMYCSGEGVEQDITKAADLWYKAALQGYAQSQAYLAFLYRNGQGLRQNYSEALKWYRKAAEQDNPDALFELADMYEKGEGVMRDAKQAVKLYSRAGELGHDEALKALERLQYLNINIKEN